MAQYRVKARSFINNTIVDEGKVIEFDGVPGSNLEPVDKPAEKAAAAAVNANQDSLVRMSQAAAGAEFPAGL